jgi:thiosulfate reductase cytochrome b subunit
VPLHDLEAAYLEGVTYHADVLAAFDADGNGALETAERVINTSKKAALIAGRLAALGLENPRIAGEIQPYSINHNVTGEWATRECSTCHTEGSRISQPIMLASYTPDGAAPTFVGGPGAGDNGTIHTGDDGMLYFQPTNDTPPAVLYVFGHDSVELVDTLGMLIFLGTLAGAVGHGGLRYLAARRQAAKEPALRHVYMYTVYERLWHWLQTAVILGLIFTGLVIHKPDKFTMFDFSYMVVAHNIFAAILVVNAALAAFYHLASGEIRQFLPEPHGFFHQAILQAKYYLRGIFRREPHPFEKVPERKMNPLQQITYLAILNILLPLQVITGALMWGAQQWPDIAQNLGGLAFLAPFHTLIAWLFASFVVMHVYLTTTGHTALADIKAMMLGWEDVEVHASSTKKEAAS